MQYQHHGKSLLEKAKKEAEKKISSMQPLDQLALVVPAPKLNIIGSGDQELLLKELKNIKPTYLRPLMEPAIQKSFEFLLSRENGADEKITSEKRLIIYSDFTKGTWADLLTGLKQVPAVTEGKINLEYQDMASDSMDNLAITGVEIAANPSLHAMGYTFKSKVTNFSSQSISAHPIHLEVGGKRRASGYIDLEPGQETEKVFNYILESPGRYMGKIEIKADNLPGDNQRYFSLFCSRPYNILLINGQRRSTFFQDEFFYLKKALEPDKGNSEKFFLKEVAPSFLDSTSFSDFDLVIAANISNLEDKHWQGLKQFVKSGGSLLITLGGNVQPEIYNQKLGDLLPSPLRGIKILAQPGDKDFALKSLGFTGYNFSHPLFKGFTYNSLESMNNSRTHGFFLLDPDGQQNVLMRFSNRLPALLEKSYYSGRVMLFTSTIDRDWTDFPIKTAYLPLIKRITLYLSGHFSTPEFPSIIVGNEYLMESVQKSNQVYSLSTPRGKNYYLARGKKGYFFRKTWDPGYYLINEKNGSGWSKSGKGFVCNLDPQESNTSKVKMNKMAALSQGNTFFSRLLSPRDGQQDLWIWLLLLAGLCLIGESIILI